MLNIVCKAVALFNRVVEFFAPLALLLTRIWIGKVFFDSGLTKIKSMDSTVQLFEHEYHVPLLPPELAAYLGTFAELILPVMLVLGLGGRVTIFMLFCFNALAMISYPFLWTPEGAAGLAQHIEWGLLLMLLTVFGYGKIAVDTLINRWYCQR
jgi:putative oxidoreductase